MRVPSLPVTNSFRTTATQAQYLLQETLRGIRRGGWMNWAAVSTVTVLLFLFGISLQTNWQVNALLDQLGSQLEISAYVKPGLSAEALKPSITQFQDVSTVNVVPREESWSKLLGDLGATDIQEATEALGENPLLDELKIRAYSVENVPEIAQTVAQFTEVEQVSYLSGAVQNLLQLHQGLNYLSWLVIGLLTLTALAVINTTIRLIVVARHQEIEVMQLVGATSTWIYLPFLLQGVAFGLAGAGVAWLFIAGTQRFTTQLLTHQSNFLQTIAQSLALSPAEALLVPVTLMGFGTFIGLLGSFFAVRRYILH